MLKTSRGEGEHRRIIKRFSLTEQCGGLSFVHTASAHDLHTFSLLVVMVVAPLLALPFSLSEGVLAIGERKKKINSGFILFSLYSP